MLVRLENSEKKGFYLSLKEDDVVLSTEPQSLVLYRRDDGAEVILFADRNLALGSEADGRLITVRAEAEKECLFEVQKEPDDIMLATAQGYLTAQNGVPWLQPWSEQGIQRWKVVPENES